MQKDKIDNMGFQDLAIVQNDGFRYGIDSVLLSKFVSEEIKKTRFKNKKLNILDIGSGSGAISFILKYKLPNAKIIGIEKSKKAFERAVEGLKINHFDEDISFINCDIKEFEKKSNYDNYFDVVVTNPPYFRRGGSIESTEKSRHEARCETTATLNDFIKISSKLLKKSGKFFIVYRPTRMAELIYQMVENEIEPKTIQFVKPTVDKDANIILVSGVSGGRHDIILYPDIVVRDKEGEYTNEILEIYERGKHVDVRIW